MRYLALLIILFIATACARVSSPMGGPEDETPPNLITSIPNNQQTDYRGNIVVLEFDEWITTTNIESDLIITPKIESGFKTRVKKQTLQLLFNKKFNDSTTYTFSFASTVTDITNNNPMTGLTLSFATGPFLDSLQISGTITKLYEQEPAEDYLISLYNITDSLTILDGPASYYTKTDTSGMYNFQNLPSGKYLIYALNDENANSKADTESERIGYYSDTLKLRANLSNIDFTVQNLDVNKPRIVSGRPFGKYFDIEFNKDISFEVVQNNSKNQSYNLRDSRNVRFYNTTSTYNDTTALIVSVTDSAQLTLIDTLKYYFIDSKIEKESLSVSILPSTGKLKPQDTLIFEFNKPISTTNTDSLLITGDSTTIINLSRENFVWNNLRTRALYPLELSKISDKTNKTELLVNQAAFISIEKDSSSSLTQNLSLITPDDVASIEGQVFTNSPNVIVQLINSRSKNIVASTRDKRFKFSFLDPGQYLLRAIDDINGNGKWDIGNILTNEPPEQAYYHFDDFYKTRVIEVRKRWEQIDRNISF